ncbi:uncharacterized protein BXZ73DRAFT_55175 [Epithele typhae]|uniref:uncharacterized protein n=1 Tax=Epithele typhae TaxID=378194 RepID=UPI002008CC90|nr:uncharacterized protein BXZ73DRAFT_55175 [Epithele typhae]KAH9914059.1 hypothetical protein BXZ73DRAFT_55175 [Epithele typhae]
MQTQAHDELTQTVFDAVESLTHVRKAGFLLETALALIEAGRYGDEVEKYLEVYLRTPNLETQDISRALLARGNARKMAGERLMAKAQADFQAVAKLDPSNRQLQGFLRRSDMIHFVDEPASQRAPPEIWERIARFIPRYHLRTWLFVSAFHRDIAVRLIFHTVDLYFGEDQEHNRGLDIFDRVKADPTFARRVKALRLHWAYEENDMFDIICRMFISALPAFSALREFEWIGYPELRADLVQAVLQAQPRLHTLGLIGWHFDAVGVSGFHGLRTFILRAEDDDGFADMGEVRTVLDENQETLRHLTLGAYLQRNHSWDHAFQSATIRNLTQLELVDTRISHVVLARIAHAHRLESLTLHGTFEEPCSASVVFGSDHIIDGVHTFLPHLEEFRFVMVGHDDDLGLFQSVAQFLKQRPKLRRLDLGNCPWDLVHSVLPALKGLRVLRVRIPKLNDASLHILLKAIPRELSALHLETAVSEKLIHHYAKAFKVFHSISMLHLDSNRRRPQPNLLSDKEYQLHTEEWAAHARSIAQDLPTLDFVGWHGEHYVVVRHGGDGSAKSGRVELKELPARRRLDCAKGVDFGTGDAAWMERKDLPMDYEAPGLLQS